MLLLDIEFIVLNVFTADCFLFQTAQIKLLKLIRLFALKKACRV